MHESVRPAELRPAFAWTCEDCGRDNFERAVVAELNAEERADVEELTGEPAAGGDWLVAPEAVTCRHCGATYEADVGAWPAR